MIYIVIGPSCSGKSTFVVNTWIKGKPSREFKDLLTVCETDSAFLIGKWFYDARVKGLDRISRQQIPLITKQVRRLLGKGKDIVLEGDKVVATSIFEELLAMKEKCQLYWIRCSKATSISRNKKNGSTQKESSIKAVASKAENMFWKFAPEMQGGYIDTEKVCDWENFNLQTAAPVFPYEQKGAGKMRDDFAVFILTHGRAANVVTIQALEKGGYTGKIYFIVDDEDDSVEEYKKNFGAGRVIVFNKQAAYDRTDTMDTFNDHRAIIYARNESFRIAKDLGLKYFLMLDDDYTGIDYRWYDGVRLKAKPARQFDRLFTDMLNFLDVSGAATVAFAQGGDFVGGFGGGKYEKGLLRKAMNSFFCRTDCPIEFKGTMNEDVVTYTTLSSTGRLFFSYAGMCVIQKPTQSLDGGMTEAYKEGGTYLKSFYAVMSMPSAVRVQMVFPSHPRMHHNVRWDYCAPKILNEKWKKGKSEESAEYNGK